MSSNNRFFTNRLSAWNETENNRDMPWKTEKDPYKIWLSEIILQQTRVDQGLNYYNRFIAAFPNIKKLAAAPEQKVFKLWEGLGYYTRCKNLLATAKFISKERQGKFPDSYTEILALKGVGPYTAAAIASFAYNLPYAVVDGNVFRLLSRFFGIGIATDSSDGKKLFTDLATKLLDKTQPGIYNQAIMDFGALICKPKNPLCETCPLKTKCVAYLQNSIELFPVKVGKIVKKERWFYYLIIEYNGKTYVKKREAKDIWENLYEFVLLETEKLMTAGDLMSTGSFKKIFSKNKVKIKHVSNLRKQQLTHQTIQGIFIHLNVKTAILLKEYKAVTYKELAKLPFPRFITAYLAENAMTGLKDKNVSLNLL